MFDLNKLIRENIKNIKPHFSACENFSGEIKVWLDENENSLGSPLAKRYNRYPDSHQQKLKQEISNIKNVNAENIFSGNGSYECVDLLMRCFCEPKKDNIIFCLPTDNIYETCARINDIEIREAQLLDNFQLDLIHLENLIDENTKLILLCSPNHITGNSLNKNDVEMVLNNFNGIVIVDEAYINFARQKSFLQELKDYENLVVLQTFSHAWGLAGLNAGLAFSNAEIINVLNKIKPPFNINEPTQQLILKALEEVEQVNEMIRELVYMRDALAEVLKQIPVVEKVFDSDANFLLMKIKDAAEVYGFLLSKKIAVQNMDNMKMCENCLRITIGTEKENTLLIDAFADYINEKTGSKMI
jgi:histidinol-phosphate aminotransferase